MHPETLNPSSNFITILCPLRVEFEALSTSATGKTCEIICTGPGYEAVVFALEEIRIRAEKNHDKTEDRPPVILASLAGALNEKFPGGSAWVAQSVCDERGQTWSTTWPTTTDPGTIGLRMARVLGADQYFHSVSEKSEAVRELKADLVNIEAHALAEWAALEGYRFGVVQGVREGAAEALPVGFESWVRADGSANKGRMKLDALRHPSQIGWRHEMDQRSAEALQQMVQLLARFGLGDQLTTAE